MIIPKTPKYTINEGFPSKNTPPKKSFTNHHLSIRQLYIYIPMLMIQMVQSRTPKHEALVTVKSSTNKGG
jgi:hypothetical protein